MSGEFVPQVEMLSSLKGIAENVEVLFQSARPRASPSRCRSQADVLRSEVRRFRV